MDEKPRARPTKAQLEGLSPEDQRVLKAKHRREYQRWYKAERHKDPQLAALDRAMDLVRYRRKRDTPEGYKKIQEARQKADAKRAGDPERIEEATRRYHRHKTPQTQEIRNKAHRLRKFGLTEEVYEALKLKQNNCCAICKEMETHEKYDRVCELSIDHDHDTGKVRGLLCNNCNRGLGFLGDDTETVIEAARYLLEHK